MNLALSSKLDKNGSKLYGKCRINIMADTVKIGDFQRSMQRTEKKSEPLESTKELNSGKIEKGVETL